jgi:NADPH:quinone reductase-like Zn-dependent oxidoreductase
VKAIVYDTYGSPDVLELREIDQPLVSDDQVLVRVCATSLNAADWHLMRGLPFLARLIFGLRKPSKVTVLGGDIAGQVEAVGKNVTRFSPGDEVFGRTRAAIRPDRRDAVATGGCAEYACVIEDVLVPKPANLRKQVARVITIRESAAATVPHAVEPTGSAGFEGTHRSRQGNAGHRPDLHPE